MRTFSAAILLMLAPVGSAFQESCETCHGEEKLKLGRSIHAATAIQCIDCHGGVAGAVEKDLAHGPDLTALTDPTAAVESCGACHSDFDRMRSFGLPTNQAALYWTSQHGKLLAEGDTNVATCITCHGAHEVFTAKEPRSPVYKKNQIDTCSRCHGDAELMAGYGLSADVVAEYRGSIHGQALLEGRQLASPSCTDCHGSHGATPPRVEEVGQVCGNCHSVVQEFFRESPHYQAALDGAMTQCLSCHGSHAVADAGAGMLVGPGAGHCSTCHRVPDEPAMLVAAELYEDLDNLEDRIAATREDIRLASARGLFIEREHGYLDDAVALRARGGPMAHSLSTGLLSEMSNRGNAMLDQTYESIDLKERMLRDRKIFTAVFFALILLLRQQPGPARTGTVFQTIRPFCIEAMRPISQGLAIHAADLRGVRPAHPVVGRRQGQKPANLTRIAARLGQFSKLKAVVVVPKRNTY